MPSPPKLFILRVPSDNPVAKVLIRHPTSSSSGEGPVGQGGCPLGSHPLPPMKVTSSSSTSGSPSSCWKPPVVQGWAPGGAFNSICATPCQMSSINCLSWTSPGSIWNWHGVLPSGWGLLGGDWGTSSLSGIRYWGSSISHGYISPQVSSSGRRSMKSNRFFVPSNGFDDSMHCSQHFITGLKLMTDSVAKNWSTPLGCVCPTSKQSSVMSSSCMKATSNGVPSPLATTRIHIWLRSSVSLPRLWLWATKVVAVDVVDILGGRKGSIWQRWVCCEAQRNLLIITTVSWNYEICKI